MSGDFNAIQLAFLTALGVARFWTQREQPDGVEPGDFAARNDNDGAAIRARNHACTPTEVWHFPPEFAGLAGGETGV